MRCCSRSPAKGYLIDRVRLRITVVKYSRAQTLERDSLVGGLTPDGFESRCPCLLLPRGRSIQDIEAAAGALRPPLETI